MERRTFFQKIWAIVGSVLVFALGTVPGAIHVIGTALAGKKEDETWIDLGPTSDLSKDRPTDKTIQVVVQDGWKNRVRDQVVFALPKGNGWEVRSSICPHLGCLVSLELGKGEFVCPCHSSYFNLKGAVISGPAPRGLDTLPSKTDGDHLLCRWVEYESGRPTQVEV